MAGFITGPLGFGKRRRSVVQKYKSPTKRSKKFQRTVEFSMISVDHFSIHGDCLNDPDLDKVFESISSGMYNEDSENWEFHLNDRNVCVAKLKQLGNLNFIDCPLEILNIIIRPIYPADERCLKKVSLKLLEVLEPFEKQGVCSGVTKNGRIMIADENGLNKKLQGLAIADYFKTSWPLLICTTRRSKDIWAEYIEEFYPDIFTEALLIVDGDRNRLNAEAKVIICTHARMAIIGNSLAKKNINCIIFDESHCFKNYKSARTEKALMLARCAKHVILLSGAPAVARPNELFTQLRMIDNMFLNFLTYANRYCEAIQLEHGLYTRGAENLEELNLLLRHFMVRRTKEEIMLTSSITRTILRLCPRETEIDEEYVETLREWKRKDRNENLCKRYHSYTAEMKKGAICTYLSQHQDELDKTIIYAIHKVMLDAIEEFLDRAGILYVRIDGSTSEEQCRNKIYRFKDLEHYRVALLSISLGESITMTEAKSIIFAELDWSPTKMIDAESRVHRFGNDRAVQVTYLLLKDTTDDVIWGIIHDKESVLTKAGIYNQKIANSEDFEDYAYSNSVDSSSDDDQSVHSSSDSSSDKKDTKSEKPTILESTSWRLKTRDSDDSDMSGCKNDAGPSTEPIRQSRRIKKRNGLNISDSEDDEIQKHVKIDDPADSEEIFKVRRKTKAKRNIIEDLNENEKISSIIDSETGDSEEDSNVLPSSSGSNSRSKSRSSSEQDLYVPPGFRPLSPPISIKSDDSQKSSALELSQESAQSVLEQKSPVVALFERPHFYRRRLSSENTYSDAESVKSSEPKCCSPKSRFKKIVQNDLSSSEEEEEETKEPSNNELHLNQHEESSTDFFDTNSTSNEQRLSAIPSAYVNAIHSYADFLNDGEDDVFENL